jgi:hypothetical protein
MHRRASVGRSPAQITALLADMHKQLGRDAGSKFVVFSQHREILPHLAKVLDAQGLRSVQLHHVCTLTEHEFAGSTPATFFSLFFRAVVHGLQLHPHAHSGV